MPPTSETTGLMCPMQGCGGSCHVEPGSHNQYGKYDSWAKRVKVCDKCGCRLRTLETIIEILNEPVEIIIQPAANRAVETQLEILFR